jgi:transcriptional antiterminator RfaH
MDWYVVQTKSRQERRALVNLENQGYPCYLPLKARKKLNKNLSTVELEPLFKNYLFISLDISASGKSWAPIRSTLGVSRIVSFGPEPIKVEPDLIETIRSFEKKISEIEPEPLFNSGQRVLVTQGPFRGIEAVYELEDGDARSFILIEILGKLTRIHIETGILSKS